MPDRRNSGPYGQGERAATLGPPHYRWYSRTPPIRYTHVPTGAWAIGDGERSMHRNDTKARALLRVALARVKLFGAVHPAQDPVRAVDLVAGRMEDYTADLVIEGVTELDLGTPDGCRLLDEALPAAIRARHERGA